MPSRIGIVADDLTGAADTGVAFRATGRAVVVGWSDMPDAASLWREADVVSLTTGSRARHEAAAGRLAAAAVEVCRTAGVHLLYKKIDSLLRGHVAAEVRAARAAWGDGTLAIVAPAFPATGRTTIDGRQHVGGAPLASPVSVPALFAAVGLATRHATLSSVRSGGLSGVIDAAGAERIDVLVCDAETEEDLGAIAWAGLHARHAPMWVGSGGLARALASVQDGLAPAPAPTRQSRIPVLVVVGSMSPLARAQATALVHDRVQHVVIEAPLLEAHMPALGPSIERIETTLRAGHDVVVTIGDAIGGTGPDDASLMTLLGQRLVPCASAIGTAVLTGGDTATGVLRAWGVFALRLDGELEPGVVLASTLGGVALPVVTKSGSFGDPFTLRRIRQRLRASSASIGIC